MDDRKQDFKWRYQPSVDSDKGKMLAYIQNRNLHPSQDKTTMIITALTAYYMPLALYSSGNYSHEKLELILCDSVSDFANHLKYTCAVLDIDPTIVGNVLCNASQIPFSSHKTSSKVTQIDDEKCDVFDPQIWNLAGITTDSQTF